MNVYENLEKTSQPLFNKKAFPLNFSNVKTNGWSVVKIWICADFYLVYGCEEAFYYSRAPRNASFFHASDENSKRYHMIG